MEERDLGTLIETGLKDLAGRIDESRLETRQLFEKLDVKIDQTRVQLEGKIDQTRVQLEGKIDQTRVQLEGKIEKTELQVESLRGDIRQLAEGIANVDEKVDRHIEETARQFDDVKALMRLYYVPLEQRVTALESRRR